MPQRFFLTVVVLIFSFSGEIFAQEKNVEKFMDHNGNLLPQPRKDIFFSSSFFSSKGYYRDPVLSSQKVSSTSAFTPVAKDYYSKHLGFFCRKEVWLEKSISLPLRFRLGSVEYTDYMEGKPNAVLPR
jgi:hypothetical protein